MKDREEFYSKLKERLNATTKFPTSYLYKFIVKGSMSRVKEVEAVFSEVAAKISQTPSKTGKYISVSVSVKLSSADEVISYYKKAETIEGIISL